MLSIGTSGFLYDDWRGAWYPPDLPRSRFFDYYADRFSAVEINSTFYHIYAPRMMESLVRRAEGRVKFAVKMTALVTHEKILNSEVVLSYAAGIEPALREGVLSAVLLQFPQRFHFTPENRAYLDSVRKAFSFFPLVLEIRHQSWRSPHAWKYLRENRINLCLTDSPRLRGLPERSFELTGDMAYVRFHGRNPSQWFHERYPGGRYDYYYSREEMLEWVEPVEKIERKAETAFVFFNNHVRGQAPANAETFMSFFGQSLRKPSYQDFFRLSA